MPTRLRLVHPEAVISCPDFDAGQLEAMVNGEFGEVEILSIWPHILTHPKQ